MYLAHNKILYQSFIIKIIIIVIIIIISYLECLNIFLVNTMWQMPVICR